MPAPPPPHPPPLGFRAPKKGRVTTPRCWPDSPFPVGAVASKMAQSPKVWRDLGGGGALLGLGKCVLGPGVASGLCSQGPPPGGHCTWAVPTCNSKPNQAHEPVGCPPCGPSRGAAWLLVVAHAPGDPPCAWGCTQAMGDGFLQGESAWLGMVAIGPHPPTQTSIPPCCPPLPTPWGGA